MPIICFNCCEVSAYFLGPLRGINSQNYENLLFWATPYQISFLHCILSHSCNLHNPVPSSTCTLYIIHYTLYIITWYIPYCMLWQVSLTYNKLAPWPLSVVNCLILTKCGNRYICLQIKGRVSFKIWNFVLKHDRNHY